MDDLLAQPEKAQPQSVKRDSDPAPEIIPPWLGSQQKTFGFVAGFMAGLALVFLLLRHLCLSLGFKNLSVCLLLQFFGADAGETG